MLTSPYGRSYIGQTTRPIEERLKEHQLPSSGCVAIYGAIQKHGWDNFEKHWYEVPDEELNQHEELMVEVLDTLVPNGYNLKEGGGSGGKPCEEVRKKMSESHKGKTHPDEVKQKIGAAHKGKTTPEEVKQKISKSHTGKTRSDEHKQNLSKSLKGRTLTDEHKQKMSETHTGKTLPDEVKQKIGIANFGDKNPNSKKLYQYNIDGTFIQLFASSGEAARSLNKTDGANICSCARGERPSAFGFKWSFTDF